MNTIAHQPTATRTWLPMAAYIAVCILWGSTYTAIAAGVRTIPPVLLAGLRFITAGGILFTWCLFNGEALPKWKTIRQSAVVGILLLGIANTALAWAEQYLNSGLAAIILAALPLWMVIIDTTHWKESFSSAKIVGGLLLGFAGVVFLVTAGGSSVNFSLKNQQQLISLIALTLGSMAWAIGSIYSKRRQSEGSTFMKASLQMLIAGVLLMIACLVNGDLIHTSWSSISMQSWAGLAYLITFGSLVGYLSFIYVLSVWPAARVGTYAYVNPIVAVFLGWAFVGEPLSGGQFIGLAVILGGVILVNSKRFGGTKNK
jgi:drug/metabolite transporter (DMT)-like permease